MVNATTNDKLVARLKLSSYMYSNRITRWTTLKGHSACAKLRQYDLPGLTVVDLGCGTGDHFPFIKQANIIGIDISPQMLEQAARKYPERALLIEADIFSISDFLKPKSVKSAVCVSTLEHLDPLGKVLEEIKKILADDGELIFGVPTEGLLYRIGRELTTKRHVQKTTGVDYEVLLAEGHVNRCRDILKALRNVFTIQRLVGVPFLIPSIALNVFMVGRCVK